MTTLRISLTDQCNYKCLFCHNEGLNKCEVPSLITPEIMEKLVEVVKCAKLDKITLTGGEPLMKKGLKDIIDVIYKNKGNLKLNMASNLALADDDFIKYISKKFDRININFQGDNRESFKYMCGGDIERTKNIINILKQHKACAISLNYVFNKLNKECLPGIVKYIQDNGFELKILELVKDKNNIEMYEPIINAKNILLDLNYKTFKVYGNDEYLENKEKSSTVRIIHSYCNNKNTEHCFLLGEVRLSPSLDLHPCIKSTKNSINILNGLLHDSIEDNAKILLDIFNKNKKDCNLHNVLKNQYKV